MKKFFLFLCILSVAFGASSCLASYKKLVPTLDGGVYSMRATENSLLAVVSYEDNNSLVKLSEEGSVLAMRRTGRNEAYQYLDTDGTDGGQIYAIYNQYRNGRTVQSMVRLLPGSFSLRLETLFDLPTNGVAWKELYLDGSGSILATGIDGSRLAHLLRYNPETREVQTERILGDAPVYKVKYVEEGRYLYIDMEGRLNLSVNGRVLPDLLGEGGSKAPFHLSTCGTRCFVSDAFTGDLYEVFADGSTSLLHAGGEQISTQCGCKYSDIQLFTTRAQGEDGIQVVALCRSGGKNHLVASGGFSIPALHTGPRVFAPHALLLAAWRAGLCFVSLGLLGLLVRGMLFSRRVLVKMTLITVVLTAAFLTVIVLLQRQVFRTSLQNDALTQYRAVTSGIVSTINKVFELDEEEFDKQDKMIRDEIDMQYQRMQRSVLNQGRETGAPLHNASISLFYAYEGGLYVYYDRTAPTGYPVESVLKEELLQELARAQELQGPLGVVTPADITDELVYVEPLYDESDGSLVFIVTISQPMADVTADMKNLDRTLVIAAVLGPALMLLIALVFRRLLRPLKEIKSGLDSFYEQGSGVQILTRGGTPRDEFYDIIRTFNRLSTETRVQMNQLATINGAYARFVPRALMHTLQRRNVLEVRPGDCVQTEACVLLLVPRAGFDGAPPAGYLERIAENTARFSGVLTDFDEGTGTVTALFTQDPAGAAECAAACAAGFPEGAYFSIVHRMSLLYGVWGAEDLLMPIAISHEIPALFRLLPALRALGGAVYLTGQAAKSQPAASLRRLGVPEGTPPLCIFEDLRCDPPGRSAAKQKTRARFDEAMALFEQGRYYDSKILFARVLRADPGDEAAKWYLFRCEDLDGGARQTDTPDGGGR